MTVENFVKKHKKKLTCILSLVIVCIVAAVAIISSMKTKATVFKKDESGNVYRIDAINILEIVAQNGQQVLGYTTPGYEPITKAEVEAYTGRLSEDGDDTYNTDDFYNATGYVVIETPNGTDASGNPVYSHTVTGQGLNDTFNLNVLEGNMAAGSISVNAKVIDEVTEDDIKNADLIFINSGDYNENLLYYYDQIKQGGLGNIPRGDYGARFGDVKEELKNAKTYYYNLIMDSVGNTSKVADLSNIAFIFAGIEEYDPLYLDECKDALVNADKSKVKTENDLKRLIANAIKDAQDAAAGQLCTWESFTDEADYELVTEYFYKANFPDAKFNYINIKEYCDRYAFYPGDKLDNDIEEIINDTNAEQQILALETLKTIKNNGEELNADDALNWFLKLNYENVYENLIEHYREAFNAAEFTFTPIDETDTTDYSVVLDAIRFEEIKNLIDDVNEEYRNTYLDQFAHATESTEAYEQFAYDSEMAADIKFDIISNKLGEDYNAYNVSSYIEKLATKEAGTFLNSDGTRNEEAIKAFIKEVNESLDYVTVSTTVDCSWDIAEKIYEAVNGYDANGNLLSDVNKKAMMYNSKLMYDSSKEEVFDADFVDKGLIHNCNYDVIDTPNDTYNSNNLYKMLLILRQLTPSYYMGSIKNNINSDGVYSTTGFDANGNVNAGATVVRSFNKTTFGYNGTNDFSKYKEPEVVGDYYNTSGQKLGSVEYVYDRIYSYTGSEFFGGQDFNISSSTSETYEDGIVGEYAGYSHVSGDSTAEVGLVPGQTGFDESTRNLYFYSVSYDMYKNYYNCYYMINFYNDRNQQIGSTVYLSESDEIKFDAAGFKTLFKVNIPAGATNIKYQAQYSNYYGGTVIISNNGSSWKKYNLNSTGNTYLLEESQTTGNGKVKYPASLVSSNNISSYNFYYPICIMTSSKLNDCVEFNESLSVALSAYSPMQGRINYKMYIYNEDPRVNTSQTPVNTIEDIAYGSRYIGGRTYITIGREMTNGQYCKLVVNKLSDSYYGYNVGTTYYYHKNSSTSTATVKNINVDGVTEFVGHTLNDAYKGIVVNYTNLASATYSYNGGATQNLSDGQILDLGGDLAEGATASLVFNFTAANGETFSASTTLKKNPSKIDNKTSLNYKLTTTAKSYPESGSDGRIAYTNNSNLYESDLYTLLNSTSTSRGDIIRYILNVTLNEIQNKPLRILEVQPAANATDLNTWDSGKINVKWLLESMKVDTTGIDKDNYTQYVKITSVSIKKFDTLEDNIADSYDMVYIGVNKGNYMIADKKTGRTVYNDTAMKGLVYTGMGDKYNVTRYLAGTAAVDYTQGTNTNATYASEIQDWKALYSYGLSGNTLNPSWNLWNTKSYTGKTTNYVRKDQATTSRLVGNDITIDRMTELEEYVKAGYPVLLANELYYCDDTDWYASDNSGSDASKWPYVDKNSKMYNLIMDLKYNMYGEGLYADGRAYPSVVSVNNAPSSNNPDYLEGEDRIKGGLSFAYKRVGRVGFEFVSTNFTQYTASRQENVVTTGNKVDTSVPFEINFNVTTSGITKEYLESNYEFKFLVDSSGIGKFAENSTLEMVCDFDVSDDAKTVKVTGEWPAGLEGYVIWKIVAYNKNNPGIIYSYIGNCALPNAERKEIYVLWLVTPNSSGGAMQLNTTMNTTINFASEIDKANIEEYDIRVVPISYDSLNNYYNEKVNANTTLYNKTKLYNGEFKFSNDNSLLKVKDIYKYSLSKAGATTFNKYASKVIKSNGNNAPEVINNLDANKKFDMLVFGFRDSPKGGDIRNAWAVEDMKWFVTDGGHSLLFTHDGTSFTTSVNIFTSGNGYIPADSSDWLFHRYMTAGFRELIGQDYFGITLSDSDIYNSENPRTKYQNTRRYLASTDQRDYRGYTEAVTTHYQSGNNYFPFAPNNGSAGYRNSGVGWTYTKTVKMVNQGQITDYPYVIPRTLTTYETHNQYLALNVDDDDTTVWYTLSGSSNSTNSGTVKTYYYDAKDADGINDYYIYTNGNVTFTSAGHNNSGISQQELDLFINTVIFAVKLGNVAPTITIDNANEMTDGSNQIDMYTDDDEVEVQFTATDIDSPLMNGVYSDIKIVVDTDDDGVISDVVNGVAVIDKDDRVLLNNGDVTYGGADSVLKYSSLKDNIGTYNTVYNLDGLSLVNRKKSGFLINKNAYAAAFGLDPSDLYGAKIYIVVSDNVPGDRSSQMVVSNSFTINARLGSSLFNLN